MTDRISRFSKLSTRMYEGLRKLTSDFDHVTGVRANTLYALERLGFAERDKDDDDDWDLVAAGVLDAADTFPASRRRWRRTDAGAYEITRLVGGKD